MSTALNQLVFVSISKYLLFILLFFRGLLIAKVFSIEEYSEWGIVMFVSAYYSIFGLGIPNLVLLAVDKYSYAKGEMNLVVSSAVIFIFLFAVVSTLVVVSFPQVFENVSRSISVLGLVVMSFGLVLVETYRNVARLAQNFKKIILADFMSVLPLLIILVIIPDILSPNIALLTLIIGIAFSLFTLRNLYTFKLEARELISFGRNIVIRGLPVLFYNFSSYSLFIVFRYDILRSGMDVRISNFNFAWLMTNSIVLFLGILNWYYYPLMLKKLAVKPNEKSYGELIYVQLVISLLILFGAPVLFDLFVSSYMPVYSDSTFHFRCLLNSQIGLYLTFYSSTFLVANKKNYVFYVAGIVSTGLLYFYLFRMTLDPSLVEKYRALHLATIIFVCLLHFHTELKRDKVYISVFLLLVLLFNYLPFALQLSVLILALIVIYVRRKYIIDLLKIINEKNSNI